MDEVLWRVDGDLEPAAVRERPNRFVLVVDRGDGPERAHLSNPGELAGMVTPDETVYCRVADDADRATDLDVVGAEADDTLVYLPSAHTNRAFRQIVERDLVDRFSEYAIAAREPTTGDGSRLDFRLRHERDGTPVAVEVKSATHAAEGVGKFPDRPTERGRRHLRHLIDHVDDGGDAMLVFIVPRADVTELRPFREVDPGFADLLAEARDVGVDLHAVRLAFTGSAVRLDAPSIPVRTGD